MKCEICDGKLVYEADIAAPGYGKSYICEKCGEPYWVTRHGAIRYSDLDCEDVTMDPSDFI